MDEMEAFKNRIFTLKDEAYSKLVLLPFLNEEKQNIIKRIFKAKDYVKAYFYGGYSTSEYKRAIFSVEEVSEDDFAIDCFKINTYEEVLLNHKMILGSLLGLGLKREVIGDIININGTSYFFVIHSMSLFICENLRKIGPYNVTLTKIEEKLNYHRTFIYEDIFVSSLRLDNVLAQSYHLGRNKAQEMIKDGLIQVNHEVVLKESKLLRVGDLLSVRGKGRIQIVEQKGYTKSGNIILKMARPN